MGGRALKSIETKRCNNVEFENYSNEIIKILKVTFANVGIPAFFKNKESFGDIDIVISNDNFKDDMRKYIINNFAPKEIFHNGNCWSFDYKDIQIDFIITPDEHFQSTLNYMSWNDLGNLTGRISHGFGLKYGQEGLWYEHYFKGENIGSVLISKDYRKIFDFLGLSYDRWVQGFNTLEEIFEYIAQSPYFNHKMFELESLNKINRDRYVKRNSYMSFLNWMHENVADEAHEYVFYTDKTKYTDKVDNAFPEAEIIKHIRKLEYEKCKELYVKSKFSAGIIRQNYGFEGKELGDIFKGFKEYVKYLYTKDFNDFVLEKDEAQLFANFEIYLKIKTEQKNG